VVGRQGLEPWTRGLKVQTGTTPQHEKARSYWLLSEVLRLLVLCLVGGNWAVVSHQCPASIPPPHRRTDHERIVREAGTLGFMARLMVQATLPHKDPGPGVSTFERSNGNLHLVIMAPPRIGLPWGKTPRLLLSWLTTEAVRTRSPRLELGANLSHFMRNLGLIPTGGKAGTITRLRDQIRRLFSSTIHCSHDEPGHCEDTAFRVAFRSSLWWNPVSPDQPDLFGSFVELSSEFFHEVVERPVPLDLRVLRALRSPLALDLYSWLTYRVSYLRRPVEIQWSVLALQFGASYIKPRNFRYFFLKQAEAVLKLYPAARLSEGPRGLILSPAPTHVRRSS